MEEINITYLKRKSCIYCGKLWAEKFLEEHENKCPNHPKILESEKLVDQFLFLAKKTSEKRANEEEKKRKALEDEIRLNPNFWILDAVYSSTVPLIKRDFKVAMKKINRVFGSIHCLRCNGSGTWKGEYQVYRLQDYICFKCGGSGKHIPDIAPDNLKREIFDYFKDKQIT